MRSRTIWLPGTYHPVSLKPFSILPTYRKFLVFQSLTFMSLLVYWCVLYRTWRQPLMAFSWVQLPILVENFQPDIPIQGLLPINMDFAAICQKNIVIKRLLHRITCMIFYYKTLQNMSKITTYQNICQKNST